MSCSIKVFFVFSSRLDESWFFATYCKSLSFLIADKAMEIKPPLYIYAKPTNFVGFRRIKPSSSNSSRANTSQGNTPFVCKLDSCKCLAFGCCLIFYYYFDPQICRVGLGVCVYEMTENKQ